MRGVIMTFRWISTLDPDKWDGLLARFDNTDIYFTAGYHKAYEANGDGKALAFVAESPEGLLFYPFLLRDFADDLGNCRDIETVYGYTGSLCTTADKLFLEEAWSGFSEWCRTQEIVTEFARFHPLIENHKLAPSAMVLMHDRETVVVQLIADDATRWSAHTTVHRNMVRKAQRNGLTCARESLTTQNLSVFRSLYATTMERVGSSEYHRFSEDYFNTLVSYLGDSLQLFVVYREERQIAAALFLVGSETLHYHLSGNDVEARRFGGNNLLLHTAAAWGHEIGLKTLHLGGGNSSLPDDPLFTFKASLSKHRSQFYIGKRVWAEERYAHMRNLWLKNHPGADVPNRLQFYRS